ncbi:MAG: carboxypeptidase, partial [Crocosphaera sp.]|nr:carboxypeptidase [Crocosphaera sp.]
SLPDGVSLISGNLEHEIDHLEGRSNKALSWLAKGTDYRRHLEWVVKSTTETIVDVTVCSERAGKVKGDFSLKSS